MSELNKTTFYFVAAMAAIALAMFTRPSVEEFDVEQRLGQLLVDDFPTDAPKRLRITSKNEETGELDTFEVAEKDGIWSIPSKSGYPADATEQLAAAVEGVVGREILDVVDANSSQHVTYGVVDPDDSEADTGFGTHVELADVDGKPLADVILGEPVTDSEGRYWVRKSGQDVVYASEIDLTKFSTNFADWIEKDLLGLSTFDIAKVSIDDYSIQVNPVLTNRGLELQIREDRRARFNLDFDDEQNKWLPTQLESFDKESEKYEPFELAEDQQLNEDSLSEMKSALDDLLIVDVERKPDGLSADLKAGDEFMSSDETRMSLAKRGFLPLNDPNNPNGGVALFSSEGQVVITSNNGVEYVLRFGDLQADPSADSSAATEGESDEEVADQAGLSRYLFVMARFNESAIEPPTIEELPELPAEESEADEEESEAEETDSEEESETEESEDTEADNSSTEDGAEEDDAEGDDAEAESDDGDADEDSESEAAEEKAPTREEIEAERTRIELNNKRAQDEYEEKIAEGKKRVDELNARFGDWYYVIPNDVFKKIHLGRDELIEKVEPEAGDSDDGDSPGGISTPGLPIPGLPGTGG